ncbi:MAG TPA: hypothetical protein VIL92_06500 [Gaiellaceae bacterium]
MLWSGLVSVVVDALNAIIAAIGVVLAAMLGLLPDMPDLASPPSQVTMVEGWVAWVFPVQSMVNLLAFVAAMYLIWWVVSIALRWAKAERGNA